EFSHSNIISIFNKKGEMVSQEEGAGINAEKVVKDLISIKN
ncbi:MAG: SCO family protein, partial [Bacteroidetes bacterium]|nr:SCO family protein [Bacteroidota bacterium]